MLFLLNSDKRTYKPSSVLNNHLFWIYVAANLHATSIGAAEQAYAPAAVLLRIGFTWLCRLRHTGELLPRLSILTKKILAVYFCCTGPKVAFGRCYLLSCSVELGLSSRYGLSPWHRAIVRYGRTEIVSYSFNFVKYLLSKTLIISYNGYIIFKLVKIGGILRVKRIRIKL